MNKGFTLIEILASLTLVTMAVLASSRVLITALAQTRQAALRFRLLEELDYHKNYLSSLPFDSAELAAGCHGRREKEVRIDWLVEDADPFLKRIRVTAAAPRYTLPLNFCRSRFILEVRP